MTIAHTIAAKSLTARGCAPARGLFILEVVNMSNAVKDAPYTPEIPLKGEKQSRQLGIDGKTVIAEKPDSLVVERAKDLGYALDQVEAAKTKATELQAALEDAFKKSKKQPFARIKTDRRTWSFRLISGVKKLEKKKEGDIK